MNTDQEILNLISDIRANVDDQERLSDEISTLKTQLETAEDDLESVKREIESQRAKLDDLIDEATGQNEDDSDSFPSTSVFEYNF